MRRATSKANEQQEKPTAEEKRDPNVTLKDRDFSHLLQMPSAVVSVLQVSLPLHLLLAMNGGDERMRS